MLDSVCPNVPVCLYRVDHHAAIVNSAALLAAGVDRTTPDPEDGRFGRDADGELDGLLVDGAITRVTKYIPKEDDRELAQIFTDRAMMLREFGVEFIDGTKPPYEICPVPDGGQMFRQYLLPQRAMEVDEFISVGKMKNHGFMGITLSLKNLFGLMPGEPEGNTRTYYHHLVRMPYMLADMGRLFNPALCIVDGLVGQAGMEWGNGDEKGPGRVANTLVAGNHTIATDACTAHLMGHDPQSDWLTPPFHRDRNSLLVAAEAGFLVGVQPLAIDPATGRPIELQTRDAERRLHQHV